MPINVNCRCFDRHRQCMHPAAPRRWFGLPDCVEVMPNPDRRVLSGCALKEPFKNPITIYGRTMECPPVPPKKPNPPHSTLRNEWDTR